jgi:hypothetical protein
MLARPVGPAGCQHASAMEAIPLRRAQHRALGARPRLVIPLKCGVLRLAADCKCQSPDCRTKSSAVAHSTSSLILLCLELNSRFDVV